MTDFLDDDNTEQKVPPKGVPPKVVPYSKGGVFVGGKAPVAETGSFDADQPRDIVTCTRRLTFCAGHRVMGHEGKCAHMHGHNYVVELEARMVRGKQDLLGRVIDFSVLKSAVDGFIQCEWDHGFLLNVHDEAAIRGLVEFAAMTRENEQPLPVQVMQHAPVSPVKETKRNYKTGRVRDLSQKLYLLPYNPTAENIARYILQYVGPHTLKGTDVELYSVRVTETENCWAEATLPR